MARVRIPAAALPMDNFKITVRGLSLWAEVAKPGQRRSPEAAVPKGFVGSNPTLRTIPERSVLLIRVRVKVVSTLEKFTELLEKKSENHQ